MLPREVAADAADTQTHEARSQRPTGFGVAQRSARTYLLQACLLTLGAVLCSTVAAQSATPNQLAPSHAAADVPLSSAQVARAALDADHRSLLELQLRENELWQVRDANSLVWPGIGLGLGLAGAVTMIPLGAALLATAQSKNDEEELTGVDLARNYRISGGVLLGLGVVALATAVYSGMHVGRRRPLRRAADEELRAIRLLRIRMLDALPTEPQHAG